MPGSPEQSSYESFIIAQFELANQRRQQARDNGSLVSSPEQLMEDGAEYTINLPEGWIEYIDDRGSRIVPKDRVLESGDLSDNPFSLIKRPTRPIEARAGDGSIYQEVIATYCFKCEGWVLGKAYEEGFRDFGTLSGKEGTRYHCPVCEATVAENVTRRS